MSGAPTDVGQDSIDVVYAHVDEVDLHASLYVPAGPGPFPSVVNVHGGAWTSGDRFNNERTSRELAAAGIAVLAVDFRMPPVAAFPAPVADINGAVRWLKANAGLARTTPSQVGGLGFSSGGHQLMLSALLPKDPRWCAADSAEPDASLAFIAVCYAVLDPVERFRMAQREGRDGLVASHRAYWADEAQMAQGSPQAIVEAGRADALPPALIVQGRNDANLLPTMAADFARAYRRAGGAADLLEFDDAPHGFLKREGDDEPGLQTTARLIEFAHLHGGGHS